ncbi:MAG: hypothetical protein H7A44_09240 [Opitutaceae bacterium]|nr:hypothetical protein [Cephaloticoccus sp.]MCP5530611.1 hypothetical protein [Opitutaceae bacterium]
MVYAQSSADEEEIVLITPFEVTSEHDYGYLNTASRIGSKVATPVADAQSSNFIPTVPITVVKPADALAIQFVVSNNADKQDRRNQELNSAVQDIKAAVQKTAGLRMEQREVRFASGDRKFLSFSKSNPTSHANIVIFADISPTVSLADRAKQVRDLLDAVKLSGNTRLADGYIGLYIKNSSSYRREILAKIFADLEFVKEGLGPEFEIRATGLNQRVKMRACSETDVELWIDYSFVIDSIRALTKPKD